MSDLERLGKYEIRSVLGRGAMGIVYQAFDPHIERSVALKTIRKDVVDPEVAQEYMARFKNEAKAAGRLHHPNIVGVYEYGEDDTVAYIVMEYVEGTGLREYLNRKASFDFGQLVALMTQMLTALEFAHAHGVIHRDIKPSNLIVNSTGLLKVADFGVARIDTSTLTNVGMVIGTPSYMSPEQCMGEETDPRSDLFSAGVVFYELLTGHKPFEGSLAAIAYKICNDEPVPPSKLMTLQLPEAVDRLVATAIAKHPAARFQSAAEFSEMLRQVAALTIEVEDSLGRTVVGLGDVRLQAPPPAWDDATLSLAEKALARYVGPMARLIVRKVATQTNDRAELCLLLSENIDDAETRKRFVEIFTKSTSGIRSSGTSPPGASSAPRTTPTSSPTRSGGSTPGSLPGTALDAAFVDRVTARLTVYLGPIARIVTKKAAQQTRSRREFVRLVADSLGTQERVAFLREMGYGEP